MKESGSRWQKKSDLGELEQKRGDSPGPVDWEGGGRRQTSVVTLKIAELLHVSQFSVINGPSPENYAGIV
jgi:hypothetical protein